MNAEVVAELEHALGMGKVQRATEGMAGTIEQLTLWTRLRAISEQILRMRELQHLPDEFMALVASMEKEAQRVIAQTQGIEAAATEAIENVSKAIEQLAETASQAGHKRTGRSKTQ